MTGTLLDRHGKPINVPVKIDQSAPAALIAELTLAPLAAGDYVLALGAGGSRLGCSCRCASCRRCLGARSARMGTSRRGRVRAAVDAASSTAPPGLSIVVMSWLPKPVRRLRFRSPLHDLLPHKYLRARPLGAPSRVRWPKGQWPAGEDCC